MNLKDSNIKVRLIGFDELKPLGVLKKERVDFKPIEHAHYLGAFIDDKIVGAVGWVRVGSKMRYKCDCVLPSFRRNGIYTKLFNEREMLCEGQTDETTAFCTEKSIGMYLSNGFEIKRKQNNGITFVTRKNK